MAKRVLCIIALAAFGLALASPNADAHAVLRSSDPAEGAQLDTSPEAVTIIFTEAPEPTLSVIRVLDSSGNQHQSDDPKRVSGDPQTLRVAVEPLDEGVYTVTWRVVSRVDGHVTAGAFAFGVGVTPSGAPTPPTATVENPPPSALEIAGRWILFAGLIGLVGGAWISASVVGEMSGSLRRYLGGAWATALIGITMLAGAQWRSSGAGVSAFAGTTIGRALLWRAVAVVVAGGGLMLAMRREGRVRRGAYWIAGIAGSVAIYAHVAAGHAAARGSFQIGKVIGQWSHFVAAAVWIGGLAALLIAVRGAPADDKARAVRRFSTVAAFALLLVAATGTYRAITEIGSWKGLFSSGYGRLVLAKVGLILVLAGLGAVNRYRNVPRATQDLGGLRRFGKAELIAAALALAAAAGLSSISPPYEVARAEPTGVVLSGSDFATSVRVRLQIFPGDVGVNRFVVTARDYDTGEPVDATRVVLRFRYLDDPAVGESEEQAERTGAGAFTVASASTLSLQGRWRILVLVQGETSSVEVPLEFATPCRTNVIPGGPGAPTLYNSKLPAGGLVQTYIDPGAAGINNEVHATYFDAAGNELPVSGPVAIKGSRSGGDPVGFEVRRFGAGHFVADATLEAGRWRFDVAATTAGDVLRSCFEQSIE